MSSAILTFEQVQFSWGPSLPPVLNLPAFTLQAGGRVLLCGPSGCGKSTLLSLAAGILLADTGQVRLLGQDWRALPARRRDAFRVDHVGYIFQQFNLLPYLSVLDNVLLPCRFSPRRAQRASASHGSPLQAAHTLLNHLGLAKLVWQQAAAQLSVGQQQRVAAARALIGQPEMVIADEPTSALDEPRRDAFMDLLLAECAAAGSALLFVSHDARLAPYFEHQLELNLLNQAAARLKDEA